MSPCSRCGCRVFWKMMFKFWEIIDRKSGGKKKIPTDAEQKIFQQHWADIRKLRSVLKRRNHKPEKLRSRQEGLLFSRVHNPREAPQQQMNEPQRSACLREKFFSSLLSACLHTHYSEGGSRLSPRSCASDVSSNVSSRKWWRSLSGRAFPRQRRQSGGRTAPTRTPGARATSAAKVMLLLCAVEPRESAVRQRCAALQLHRYTSTP